MNKDIELEYRLFLQYLKENDALLQFREEVSRYHAIGNEKTLIRHWAKLGVRYFLEKNMYSPLSHSCVLNWSLTKKGVYFWDNLSKNYRKWRIEMLTKF